MSTDRFDRQNRVYGIDGTKKLTEGTVLLNGPLSDLTYEVAKNLALSGINNIKLCLNHSNDESKNNFKPGHIHLTNIDKFCEEIKQLNPYLNIKSLMMNDLTDIQNTVVIYINPSSNDIANASNLNSSNKLVCMNIQHNANDDKYVFKFFNDFKDHIINDIDGENYELLTITEVKLNDDKTYTIKTSSPHNLSESNKIIFKLDSIDDLIKLKVKKVINALSFNIGKKLNDSFKNYINGYVYRIKDKMTLKHNPISNYETSSTTVFGNLQNEFNMSNYIRPEMLSPLVQSYCGAIISSEVIKAITHKYIPFNQTYELEFDKEIAERPNKELQDKLSNLKCFMVGSGAIGCELLKNLVSIGSSTNDGSYIKVTDPDHIEVSNLSRQFLFRSENVGKSKSEVASDRIKTFEPKTKVVPFKEKLSTDNQEFVNQHFTDVDLIFNALDNLNARLYVDSQCVKYQKALFESGTLGTKGNTQPIIPHHTESYGASQDQAQEQSFAACTIKNFPTLIQHTIHWAMDDFDGLFKKQPQMLKQYLEAVNKSDLSYLNELPSVEVTVVKNTLYRLINRLNHIKSKDDYIKWAYELWLERFNSRIERLLKTNPVDSKNDDGRLFWSNGKKCPNVRSFDICSDSDFYYILSTANLLYKTYAIQSTDTDNSPIEVTNKHKIYSNNSYCDDPDLFKEFESYPHEITSERSVLDETDKLNQINSNFVIEPQEFEKDDDTNYHILFIESTSNSRALNYSIPVASFYETKGIAGRIIPALATTTSIVANLICMEMLKYLNKPNRSIEDYRSTYINLADNMIIQSEPMPAVQNEINGIKFTEWGSDKLKFKYSKNETLQNFIDHWSKEFDKEITMVSIGSKILYMTGINESNLSKRLNDFGHTENYMLGITVDDENIILPDITII